jgi:hypothetical protein
MTNAQISLNAAIENLNNKKLTPYEAEFITKIQDYSKKELNGLSSAQYKLLMTCANKK